MHSFTTCYWDAPGPEWVLRKAVSDADPAPPYVKPVCREVRVGRPETNVMLCK